MGYTHIITIVEDGFSRFIQDESRNQDDIYCELGQKIASLCKTHGSPISSPKDPKTESLGDWHGAIAWRGFPDSAHDKLFYWGADLKDLRNVHDNELALAEKLIARERERRANDPKERTT